MVALVGAAIVGPRIGKFENGAPVLLAGHTVPVSELTRRIDEKILYSRMSLNNCLLLLFLKDKLTRDRYFSKNHSKTCFVMSV